MEERISSTEAARSFGDCIAKVKHTGRSLLICKNNKPVARLSPAPESRYGTLADFLEAWKADPNDPDFANDLERVDQEDRLFENRWGS